ncbi:hypothetical protein PAESOLCIP111_03084 [Paenibacillus solanacearum]|uniref:Aminoglycoside phosphotransferase domain-containing protein n=1 Tax=Paenibacillus solanacearum TaxID=2048548 RepID=A0A916K2Z0_9BACL|nr:phosphotransferase [Paenibacillus solanacearum]CAG7629247.1 hypothetical protein PAESOLCIP111_03084 [Paenibacillus solanacearum]
MELSRYVLPGGKLDDALILNKEAIYKGMNGKVIERFFIPAEQRTQSYIFKPLTNVETIGRERWAHTEIIPLVPQIRTPKILAQADHSDPDRYWAIMEDYGRLSHELSEEDLVLAAGVIPFWHQLSQQLVPEHLTGNKPKLEQALETVQGKWENVKCILQASGMDAKLITKFYTAINNAPFGSSQETVVSQGDFHRGNIAIQNQGVVVLDWEHVHRNSPYWDLYNLIDMTHPVIRRRTTQAGRGAALRTYASRRTELGWMGSQSELEAGYYLYSAIYSAWMLLLIEADRSKGVFRVDDLQEAEKETLTSFAECMSQH